MKFLLSLLSMYVHVYTVAVVSLVSVAVYTIDVTHAFVLLQTVIKVFFIYLNTVSGCSLVLFFVFQLRYSF